MTQFAAVIDAYNISGASATTLYYSSGGLTTASGDTPADTHFDEVLIPPGPLSRSLFNEDWIFGPVRTGGGLVTLHNPDGALDYLRGYAFDGRAITLYWVPDGAAFPGECTKILSGTMGTPTVGLNTVSIPIFDNQKLVDVPLQTNRYAGTGSLEGDTSIKGKPKPLAYGEVRNVPAVLVNPAKLIYQVSDGAVDGVTVYDSGIQLGLYQHRHLIVGTENGLDGTAWYSDDDGDTWFDCTPGGSPDDFYSAVFGTPSGQATYLIGGDDGAMYHSTDAGVDDAWASVTSNTSDDILEMIWVPDDTQFVMRTTNDFGTSPDGETWTTYATGISNTGVAYGNGVYVRCGAGSVYHSTTALESSWTAGTDPALAGNNTALAYNASADRFVMGSSAGEFSYSDDGGATWSSAIDIGFTLIDEMRSNGSTFIASSFGAEHFIGRSVYGVEWVVGDLPNEDDDSLNIFIGRYGYYWNVGANATVMWSTDGGVTWEYPATPPDISASSFIRDGCYGEMSAVEEYADATDLQDDDLAPSPGSYKVYPAGGYFRLGSTPAGLVTADVAQGANDAARTAGQLWTQLLTKVGVSAGTDAGDWLAADVTALDSADNSVCGLWTGTEEVVASQALTRLAQSVQAWWGVDQDGVYRIAVFDDPDGGTPDVDLLADDARQNAIRAREPTLPVYRVTVQYSRNYAPQGTDIAAGVSEARRILLQSEWLGAVAVDTGILTAHPNAREFILQTALTVEADAQALADAMLALFGEQRTPYDFVLEMTPDALGVDFDTLIGLVHPRFGLDSGDEFAVTKIVTNPSDYTVTLGVWK